MSGSRITKTKAETFALEDILSEVVAGRVRIPRFQRSFRWQWEDVRRLIDSIVRGYPIGSLLLWARPAEQETLSIGALNIEAPRTDSALWVVDGQQRLTSLSNSLRDPGLNDPRFAIAYNLQRQTLVKPKANLAHVIDLPTVFDLQKLLKWFSEHPESNEYLEEATRIAKAIREYSIPAYIVNQGDEEVLRDVFDRMNNYGKRLTRAEVFSALHEGVNSDSSSRSLLDIASSIDATYRFGEIDENTIMRAILARRGTDVTRDIRTEFDAARASNEDKSETAAQAYSAGEEALKKAVDFLQSEAGIPHISFLAHRYLLVVLARFFAFHTKPVRRNLELLKRWFWRAVIVGPTEFGSVTPASRTLCAKISPDNEVSSVQALLKSVSRYESTPLPTVEKFRSTSANSRILLCAMWSYHPRSFTTGKPYTQDDLSTALDGHSTANEIAVSLFPKASSEAANRVLFLESEPIEDVSHVFQTLPNGMADGVWQDFLRSHILDEEMQVALQEGDRAAFFELREARLNQAISNFLNTKIKSSFEDTPPLGSFILDEDEADSVEGGFDDG